MDTNFFQSVHSDDLKPIGQFKHIPDMTVYTIDTASAERRHDAEIQDSIRLRRQWGKHG